MSTGTRTCRTSCVPPPSTWVQTPTPRALERKAQARAYDTTATTSGNSTIGFSSSTTFGPTLSASRTTTAASPSMRPRSSPYGSRWLTRQTGTIWAHYAWPVPTDSPRVSTPSLRISARTAGISCADAISATEQCARLQPDSGTPSTMQATAIRRTTAIATRAMTMASQASTTTPSTLRPAATWASATAPTPTRLRRRGKCRGWTPST